MYWYIQQNQCLNIKKHDEHNIHISMAPKLVGHPGNCQLCPCVKTALMYPMGCIYVIRL